MRRVAAALTAGLFLLGGCSVLGGNDSDRPRVVAYFTDVGDLVIGGQVQSIDVEIGAVEEITLELRDGNMVAKVSMSIDPGTQISADRVSAVIRQTSLLGEQFVELVPETTGAPFIDTTTVTIPVERTDRLADVETFLSDLSSFVASGAIEDLNAFTHAQAVILEDRGRRFGETLEELEQFTATLAGRRFDVAAAIDDLASASGTLVQNRSTLTDFLESLDEANALLADEGDELRRLFNSLRRFGDVNARFLAKHEDAIRRQFRALRPILDGLAGAEGELRTDIAQLRTFFELFPKSHGGGPGGTAAGDYIQAEAVLCQALNRCHTNGEKGDVPGQGS